MATFVELRDQLSADSYERGKQFERVCKWFLETDPRYSNRLAKVWLWDDWPHRWGPDCGIDLVAEDTEGNTWAIQAKCYDEEHVVSKGDVDKFLSESVHKLIDNRLLIATTDRLGANARRVIRQQNDVIPVNELLLCDLEAAPVVWPSHPGRLTAGKPRKPQTPRPHQKKAIRDVVDNLNGRAQLIMACGTGKTLVSLRIAERLEAKRTLVLVPSLTLLSQTVSEWLANTHRPLAYLPVCSDETVDRGADAATMFTSDLAFPVTTDPDGIASFLRKHGPRVVFSTYQSSPRIAQAQKANRVPAFDLVIADEAHRCAGVVAPGFGTVLNGEIRARKRLFMTATPRTYTARVKAKAEEADIEVASMDDTTTFGPVAHRLSFGEAIRKNLLIDYRVVVVGINDPTYKKMVDQRRIVETDTDIRTDAKTLARHVAVAKAIRDWGLRRTITFHSRIKAAKDFANLLPRVVEWMLPRHRPDVELVCDYVSGEMSVGERNTRLNRLRETGDGQSGLLANARCLSEGIDVPSLDGVAFVEPRRSEVDIVQAVGRAIRLSDDKTTGTIIVPVFISDTDNPDTVLSASEFAPVWSVIRALRSHDDELGQALDALRTQLGHTGSASELPPKIHLDLPGDLPVGFVDAFETRLVEATTANWDFNYGLLQRFVEREGHCRVPRRHVALFEGGDLALGNWCGTNRYLVNSGSLSDERIVALDALGFDWDPLETNYQRNLAALAQFVAREGHTRVPQGYRETFDGEELKLNVWVAGQREARRNGELSPERVAALVALGFDWDPYETDFRRGLAALTQFEDREGHARVPQDHWETFDGEELALGQWCHGRRMMVKREELSPERIAALDALGFDWNPLETDFERGLAALAQFVAREGHARVPSGHVEALNGEDYPLGAWVSNKRTGVKSGRLPDEKVKALDALGFDMDPNETERRILWRSYLTVLAEFVEREGHARVPNLHEERVGRARDRLGAWVVKQRMARRRGKLSREMIDELDALGFDWNPLETDFERGLAALTQFVAREGHARVPQGHAEPLNGEDYPLGDWVINLRHDRRGGRVSAERVERLDALGFDWDPKETDFQRGLAALTQFVDREGHARVPGGHTEPLNGDEVKLTSWINSQRSGRRQNRYSSERIAALDALGFDWDPLETDFQRRLAALTQFVDREGHARVPSSYVTSFQGVEVRLGTWVANRRREYRDGSLSSERIAAFDALGVDWDRNPSAGGRKSNG